MQRYNFGAITATSTGNRNLIAYLFFLKDSKRFVPIAPTTFDKALRLLEIDLVTAHNCSWQNYSRFNEALLAVKQMLRDETGLSDARLIDAHSFCWMLVRLELPASPPAVVIPLPEALSGIQSIPPEIPPSIDDEEFAVVDEEQFLKRDAERRRLGKLAQDIALRSERLRLLDAGHPNPDGWFRQFGISRAAATISNRAKWMARRGTSK
jgi:hypothetical protein